MACHHPLPAWRTGSGGISLGKPPDETPEIHLSDEIRISGELLLPCGKCLGCKTANAKAWALRCHLELQQHPHAAFATLTYDDDRLPPTLSKPHLQRWLKRFRKKMGPARPIRFFACGEYGEQRERPHYHALLYGASIDDTRAIEDTWGMGHARVYDVTPARIAYVAGYCAKKLELNHRHVQRGTDVVDVDTGEVIGQWQQPFIQMSRRPGIGGHARQWPQSWRLYAIHNGHRMPVPRFLHESWKNQASDFELEQLKEEKHQLTLTRDNTPERRKAAEQIAIAKQKEQSRKRKLS